MTFIKNNQFLWGRRVKQRHGRQRRERGRIACWGLLAELWEIDKGTAFLQRQIFILNVIYFFHCCDIAEILGQQQNRGHSPGAVFTSDQLQVQRVIKIILRFDNSQQGFVELTGSYYTHIYGSLQGKDNRLKSAKGRSSYVRVQQNYHIGSFCCLLPLESGHIISAGIDV